MTSWRGRDRRTAPGGVEKRLEQIAEHLEHVRDSLHELRNGAGVISFRVARLEADVRKVETSVDELSDVSQQLRGALTAMRLFTGGSLLTAAGAVVAMGRALAWW